CASIQIPDFRPGASAGSRHTKLRQLAQKAMEELRNLSQSAATEATVTAVRNSISHIDPEAGGPGLTIFCSPSGTDIFETPGIAEKVTVGDRFHVVPVLEYALAPSEIVAIGVNRKRIRLWEIEPGACEELALPPGVPENIDAALDFDRPDHTLENRSS